MSDKTHTQGPLEARKGDVFNPDRTWGIVKPLSREECIEIDGDDSAFGKRTEIIAEVCSASNGADEADAILLAASTELLAVLEQFVALDTGVLAHGPMLHDDARAAIRKAKGD